MLKPVHIPVGRLRKWLERMNTFIECQDLLAERHAKVPHLVGSVNKHAHQAEFLREILQDFLDRTQYEAIPDIGTLPDDAVLTFIPEEGLTGWIQRIDRCMGREICEALNPTERTATPELASRSDALTGAYALARTQFLDITGLRDGQISPQFLPEPPEFYEKYFAYRWEETPPWIREFCARYGRAPEAVRGAIRAEETGEDVTSEKDEILQEYLEYMRTIDVREPLEFPGATQRAPDDAAG